MNRSVFVSVAVAAMGSVETTRAAVAEYHNRGDYLSAAGAVLVEGLEGLSTNPQTKLETLSVGFGSIAATQPSISVLDFPLLGGHAVDGSKFAYVRSVGAQSLVFSFDMPTTTFGITIMGWGVVGGGQLAFETDSGEQLVFAEHQGGPPPGDVFFGAVSDAPFREVTIRNTIHGQHILFDEVFYIPGPASIAAGFGVILATQGMRNRRTTHSRTISFNSMCRVA